MSASSLLPPPPPSPSSTKLKRGSLYKQRDFRSGWPTRLFVLDPPLLHYYIDPNDASPRKSIYVVNCSITANQPDGTPQPAISDNNNTLYPFQISHPSTTKTYNLACGSKEERDDWVRALTKAAQPTPIPATPDADSPPKPPPSLKNAASLITSAARTLKINPHYVTSVPSHFHPLLESTMQKLRDLASADLPRTDQPALTGPVPWKPLFEKKVSHDKRLSKPRARREHATSMWELVMDAGPTSKRRQSKLTTTARPPCETQCVALVKYSVCVPCSHSVYGRANTTAYPRESLLPSSLALTSLSAATPPCPTIRSRSSTRS